MSLCYKVFGYESSIKNTEECLRTYLVSFLSGFSLEVVNHSSEQSYWEESVIGILRNFIARSWDLQQAYLVLQMSSIEDKKMVKALGPCWDQDDNPVFPDQANWVCCFIFFSLLAKSP